LKGIGFYRVRCLILGVGLPVDLILSSPAWVGPGQMRRW
jgi:hypothetical protein